MRCAFFFEWGEKNKYKKKKTHPFFFFFGAVVV